MRKSLHFALICSVFFSVSNCPAATVNGTIQGTVVDDTGHPVPNARVVISYTLPSTARPTVAPPIITGPLAQAVMTNSAGAFDVDNIRAGRYIACAQTLAPGLLDPCRWSASAPEVTVVAGKIVSGVRITMAHGLVIPIHVNDPQGLLKSVTGPIDFTCQFHVVTAKGIHYNANIQASTATGRDHSITVPFGTPVTLLALSPHLTLSDSSGKPVIAAALSTISASAGAVLPTFAYTVTGTK